MKNKPKKNTKKLSSVELKADKRDVILHKDISELNTKQSTRVVDILAEQIKEMEKRIEFLESKLEVFNEKVHEMEIELNKYAEDEELDGEEDELLDGE